MLGRAEVGQPCERRDNVVDVPVQDHAGRVAGRVVRRVAAVDQTEFVLVVPDTELGVARTVEVRLDAEQVGCTRPSRRRRRRRRSR